MDGGWRFFSGEETQEHAADASSFETYDLNTIANYDPDLVPYLDAPRAHGGRRRACASFARPLCTGPTKLRSAAIPPALWRQT